MARIQLVKHEPARRKSAQFLPSGSTLLDRINGGGWAMDRMINLVGNKSSGKSLLAIEACANFAHLYGEEDAKYNETEEAFDRLYAQSIGMPPNLMFTGDDANKEEDRHGSRTVQAFSSDLENFIKPRVGKDNPCFYCLDSVDAMSDDAELARELGDATYGTAKAKLFSEFFRTKMGDIAKARCLLFMVSQIRDNIGVMFGDKYTRSGGHALDFYASQIVWLDVIKPLKRQAKGVERVVGSVVLAKNKKNKVGIGYAQAEIQVLFNYGVDDEMSNVEWLKKNKQGAANGTLTLPIDEYKKAIEDVREARDFETLFQMRKELSDAVTIRWQEVEEALRPKIGKYERMA